jgi:hypothetical protein
MPKQPKMPKVPKPTAAERKRGVQAAIPKVSTPRPQTRGRRHTGLFKPK